MGAAQQVMAAGGGVLPAPTLVGVQLDTSKPWSYPAGAQAGDLAIMFVTGTDSASAPAITGWDVVANSYYSGAYTYGGTTYSRVLQGSDTEPNATPANIAAISVWRGASGIEDVRILANSSGDSSVDTSLTSTKANSIAITFWSQNPTGSGMPTPPSGWTELVELQTSNYLYGYVIYKEFPTPGSPASGSATMTNGYMRNRTSFFINP